ncbi:GcrA cell cycle regulator [Rhodobacteraceae bacterium RKSG542]|uniref:GcrA family cell cycle regulator n=1 Tax=Pseudovibrio flavus TaxID=2529854 RepID=UPI0012BC175B|nr:GcrA family cell cycle regulator [Pseudovibrio flavus]MTI18765.1 GcrA cell cycle regulator [Pseudovibrio flavus]
MSWTTERVELLTKLWAEGLSASQIAAELGNVTRNAVIGKVHRLGLSGRTKSAPAAKPRRTAATASAQTGRKPDAEELIIEQVVQAASIAAASPKVSQSQPITAGATALKVELLEEEDLEVAAVPAVDVFIPVSERATILTLTERTCKWPIGDPGSEDFHFCGRQSDASTPYCAHHRQIAYQPVNDRRRERKTAAATA